MSAAIPAATIKQWNKRRIELGSIAKLAKELGRSAESVRALLRRRGLYLGRKQ